MPLLFLGILLAGCWLACWIISKQITTITNKNVPYCKNMDLHEVPRSSAPRAWSCPTHHVAPQGAVDVDIDQHECISCGTCVEQTEDVFYLGEDDKSGEEVKAEVLKQEGPMDLIQDAIDACPVTCIHWLDGEELTDIHSAGGVSA